MFMLKALLGLFISASVIANGGIYFKVPAIDQVIQTEDLIISQAQGQLKCRFSLANKPTRFVFENLFTSVVTLNWNQSSSEFQLKIKGGTLWDFLPTFDVHNCAYKIIFLGQTISDKKNLVGDVVILGKEFDRMSDKELDDIHNYNLVKKSLAQTLENMILAPRENEKGKTEIVNINQ